MYDTYVDYKKMYILLFGAMEDAMNKLIAAQRLCEELFVEMSGVGPSDPEAEDLPTPA